MKIVLRILFFFFGAIGVCLWVVVKLSANTLPGDSLYPEKIFWEKMEMAVAIDSGYRETLSIRHKAERKVELKTLIEEGRVVRLLYTGLVQGLTDKEIVVDGIECQLETDTKIEGREFMEAGTLADLELETQPMGVKGNPKPPLVLSVCFPNNYLPYF